MAIAFIHDGHSLLFCVSYLHDGQEITTHIHTNSIVQIKGSAERLQKRKISQSTCERFKVYRDGRQAKVLLS